MNNQVSATVDVAIRDLVRVKGEPKTWEQAIDLVLSAFKQVMLHRHAKYGPGNINRRGVVGVEVRIGDKLERLTRWVDSGMPEDDHADEGIDDTLGDIANYAQIAVLFRHGWWNLPAAVLGQVAAPIPVVRANPICDVALAEEEYAVSGFTHRSGQVRICRLCGGSYCDDHIDGDDHDCEGAQQGAAGFTSAN